MHILSLDVATTTGVAWGDVGSVPKSRSVRIKTKNEEVWQAGVNLCAYLTDHLRDNPRPDWLVLEAPLHPAVLFERAKRSGRPQSMGSLTIPWSCVGALAVWADSHEIPLDLVDRQTVLKFFTGKRSWGKAVDTKRLVIDQCYIERLLPPGVTDDNRADAIAQWKWGEAKFGGTRELKMFAT